MTKLERYTLYIVALTVPLFFIPNFLIEAQIQKYMLFSILMSILLVMWAFRMVTHDIELTFSLPVLGWFLFSIVCVISSFNLIGQPFFWNSFEVGMYILFTAIIAIYLSNLRIDERFITKVCFILMITGLIISIDGIVNYYFSYSLFLGKYIVISKSTFSANIKSNIGQRNFISDYLALLLPFSIYFLFSIKGVIKIVNNERIHSIVLIKLISFISFMTMLYVILISGSKGTYASAGMALTIGGISYILWWMLHGRSFKNDYNRRLKVINTLFILVVICLTILSIVALTPKLTKLLGTNIVQRAMNSLHSRKIAWDAAILQFKTNPIIGGGIGTFKYQFLNYQGKLQEMDLSNENRWMNAKRTHNDYLQMLGETGIIGFVLLMFTIVTLMIYFFKHLSRAKDGLFLCVIGASILVTLFHSAVSFPMHILPNNMIPLFLISLTFGRALNTEKQSRIFRGFTVDMRKGKRYWLYGFILFLCITVSCTRFAQFMGEGYMDIARRDMGILNDYTTAQNRLHRDITNVDRQLKNHPADKSLLNAKEQLSKAQHRYDKRIERYYKKTGDMLSSSTRWYPRYGPAWFEFGILKSTAYDLQRMLNELDRIKDTGDRKAFEAFLRREFPYIYKADAEFLVRLAKAGIPVNQLCNGFDLPTFLGASHFMNAKIYYEKALEHMNDRNLYKNVAEMSYYITDMERSIYNTYNKVAMKNKDSQYYLDMTALALFHKQQFQKEINDMCRYFDRGIYVARNIYWDWQIYRDYLDRLVKLLPYDPKLYDVILKVARMRSEAGIVRKTWCDLPWEILTTFEQIKNMKELPVSIRNRAMNDLEQICHKNYEYALQKLKIITVRWQQNQIKNFIKRYEKDIEKESE